MAGYPTPSTISPSREEIHPGYRRSFTQPRNGCHRAGEGVPDKEALREEIIKLKEMGAGARTASAAIAKSSNLSRREAYRMWLEVISEERQP